MIYKYGSISPQKVLCSLITLEQVVGLSGAGPSPLNALTTLVRSRAEYRVNWENTCLSTSKLPARTPGTLLVSYRRQNPRLSPSETTTARGVIMHLPRMLLIFLCSSVVRAPEYQGPGTKTTAATTSATIRRPHPRQPSSKREKCRVWARMGGKWATTRRHSCRHRTQEHRC